MARSLGDVTVERLGDQVHGGKETECSGMTVVRWHSGGTLVAGDTVIRVWEYGGMVAWCSKWVVV